jgi:hypothetical protein
MAVSKGIYRQGRFEVIPRVCRRLVAATP